MRIAYLRRMDKKVFNLDDSSGVFSATATDDIVSSGGKVSFGEALCSRQKGLLGKQGNARDDCSWEAGERDRRTENRFHRKARGKKG